MSSGLELHGQGRLLRNRHESYYTVLESTVYEAKITWDRLRRYLIPFTLVLWKLQHGL
jgi:hypothetical protein